MKFQSWAALFPWNCANAIDNHLRSCLKCIRKAETAVYGQADIIPINLFPPETTRYIVEWSEGWQPYKEESQVVSPRLPFNGIHLDGAHIKSSIQTGLGRIGAKKRAVSVGNRPERSCCWDDSVLNRTGVNPLGATTVNWLFFFKFMEDVKNLKSVCFWDKSLQKYLDC